MISRGTVTLLLTSALALSACKGGDATAKAGANKTASPAKQPAGLPGQSEADLAAPVAIIDGQTITVAELQDRINKQSPYVRARYQSMEQKKEFLDTIVRFEILAREADKRGFDDDPEVVRTMKQVMIQRLLKEQFDTSVKPDDITDAEMQQYYQAHLGDYNKPEEVRVSAVITKDKAKAQKAADEAKAQANGENRSFRELVEKYSEDADSKSRGGDLRFFAADNKVIPAEVVAAAFKLRNSGETAGPIQTSGGWYVIRQTGLRKEVKKEYDEVKRQIQNRLFRDKRNEAMETFVTDLKKTSKIEIKEDALAKVKVDTTQAPGPEGMVPGEHGMAPGAVPGAPPSAAPPGEPAAAPGEAPAPAKPAEAAPSNPQ